jgi:Xaa-Pro aminopeptidase
MAIDADRHRLRRDRVRTLATAQLGADTLIVTHLPNVRYLTGFSGSNAVLVLGEDGDGDLIGTDGRYVDQVAMEAPGLPTLIDRDTLGAVVERVAGPRRAAVEASLPIGDLPQVRDRIGEPVVATGLVEHR